VTVRWPDEHVLSEIKDFRGRIFSCTLVQVSVRLSGDRGSEFLRCPCGRGRYRRGQTDTRPCGESPTHTDYFALPARCSKWREASIF
jgi:hypothetical protein